MSENWIGKAVSIKCVNDFGVFQGTIKDANSNKIVISKAFRNGLPIKTLDTEVTIMASDIVKISLIPSHNAANINNGIQSTDDHALNKDIFNKNSRNVPTSPLNNQKPKTGPKAQANTRNTFGNLIPAKVEVKLAQPGPTIAGNTNNNVTVNTKAANQPIESIAPPNVFGHVKQGAMSGQLMQQTFYNKKEKKKGPNRCLEAFGTPVNDPEMDEDFDFEKNLALFDKQAIWDQIDAKKPDLVRQTGHVNKKNYRHDENILNGKPLNHRQIQTQQKSAQQYVTDEGIIIPTISAATRSRIQMQSELFGLEWGRQCDMLSRSTVEMALQLLGGARRLAWKNQHQWPKISIICDDMCSERHSDIGLSIGRQIASQGLKVFILVKPNMNYALQSNREAELFKATGNVITMNIDDLPSSDLIILTVPKPITDYNVVKWINECRSPIMAVDPPICGVSNLNIKCSILPLLPLDNIDATCGKLYLSNLTIPDKFYHEAGINYKSPFGHKFLIPLHAVKESTESQK